MHAFFRAALLAVAATALPALAAEFGFRTVIRLGESGGGWEFAAGDNSGGSASSLSDYWASGASRQFQVTYDRPANNVQLRLYANDGSSSTALNFSPAGGPAAPNAIWRLPASSFFATAITGANVWTGVTLSNMTLSGVTGAINILSPMQQTWMQAGSSQWQPSQTVAQSQDIVFRGDATGSWRLAGYVTMNFWGLSGTDHQDRLQFGLSALSDSGATPEPSSMVLLLTGLAGAAFRRKRASGPAKP